MIDYRNLVAEHYSKSKLFDLIINAFKKSGIEPNQLTLKDLKKVDEFHIGGLEATIDLLDNLQLIPEINNSFKNKSDFNSSLALRYSFQPGKSIDFYYSNAVGIQDIGQLLEDKEYRFGFKLNFLY